MHASSPTLPQVYLAYFVTENGRFLTQKKQLGLVASDWYLWNALDALFADKAQTVFDVFVEQVQEILLRFLLEMFAADVTHPRPDVRHPLEFFRVAVHHAASETPTAATSFNQLVGRSVKFISDKSR